MQKKNCTPAARKPFSPLPSSKRCSSLLFLPTTTSFRIYTITRECLASNHGDGIRATSIFLARAIHNIYFYFSIFNENFFFNEIYSENLFQSGIFFNSNYSITKSRVQLRKKFLFPFMKLFHADTFDSNFLKNIFSQIHTVSYENNNSIRTFPSLGRK